MASVMLVGNGGEYMANDGNSCLLQSINLYNLVNNKFEDNAEIDYKKFDHLIRLSIRMMNQTQDYGYDMLPLDKNRKNVDEWNSIGLGVFGLADMFVAMKIKYGSKESIELVSRLFDFMNFIALDESCNEAKKHGTFGKYDWEKQKQSPIIKALRLTKEGCELYDKIEKYGLRNSSVLSIPPTGTISLFMGKLSGGIEPLFKLWYERTSHQGEKKNFTFRVMSRSVEDLINHLGLPHDISKEELMRKCPWLIESHDIAPEDRIKMQSVMQEYVDNSISSTINLPNSATWEDIYNIYISAWKQGCKGVTVFRSGCERQGILGTESNKKEEHIFKYDSIEPISRRGVKEVQGCTIRLQTACVDKFYLHINKTDDGELFEVFANPSNGCISNINTITRLVSTALRSGIKVEEIIKDLKASKCAGCQALRNKGNKDIELSCGNAIAKALEMCYNKNLNGQNEALTVCRECGAKAVRLEGKCSVCGECGASACSE